MNGWSFCIVTAPGNERMLKKCLEKIAFEIPKSQKHEIIIVGNANLTDYPKRQARFIPFQENFWSPGFSRKRVGKFLRTKDIRSFFYKTGAIGHKKNLAAAHAQYNKLCIMHDYVGIEPGWLKGYETFGEEWDVAMNRVLNADGSRSRDWVAWDHPAVSRSDSKGGACLLPYDLYSKYMYISGQYFCVKKRFMLENPFDETLFWGEGEDVEWSLRVRKITRFKMNQYSSVKYLKLKRGAPNCPAWREAGIRLEDVLRQTDEVR